MPLRPSPMKRASSMLPPPISLGGGVHQGWYQGQSDIGRYSGKGSDFMQTAISRRKKFSVFSRPCF